MQEARFHDLVAAWLRESFVDVEHEPTLMSGLEPDFVVRTPFESYVLEVENSADSLFNAIGQAAVYAELTNYDPVAVFPADDPPPSERVPTWLTVATV